MSNSRPLSTRPMRIPPRLDRRGTQLAGWTPRSKAPPAYKGILFDADVAVPLPDGTVLRADLFRPAGAGPVPALVSWAVYIKDTERLGGGPFIDESGVHPYVIENGYAVIRIQPRGTGRSGGLPPEEMSSAADIQDCRDAIEWVATQPWCDGSVGMTGMSAFGIAQLHVAAARPPSLKAIFPYKAMTDVYRHGFFKGGAPYTGAIELFAAFEKLVPPSIPNAVRHLLSHVLNTDRFAMEMSDPIKTQTKIRQFIKKHPPTEAAARAYVGRIYDHGFDDGDYWRSKSVAPKIESIEVPVCIATDYGAQGFHFFGAFELWHKLRCDKWLFFGPPEYVFPWANYQEELVAWYDWQLKGIDNGYRELPRVRYWLRGAERWERAASWPLPDARATRFYLAAGPDRSGTHGLEPAAPRASATSYLAIPSTSYYVAKVDDIETQLLRYATEPFGIDTEVVGPVTLALQLSATAIDTYVVARLDDLAPDGRRRKLAWGWLLASHRTIDAARSNPTEIVHDHSSEAAIQLVPGKATELKFSLTPIANVFAKGHRLELNVASRPELLVSESGEGFDMFCWDPIPYRSRNVIHHGGAAPSWLEVSIRAP
ncbi:MAG: CocE/NonD family hydrolase [Pseudomonadota bacterium]|nr:CocE/NonD family hydrolase [Pseudomonadota bacterium]